MATTRSTNTWKGAKIWIKIIKGEKDRERRLCRGKDNGDARYMQGKLCRGNVENLSCSVPVGEPKKQPSRRSRRLAETQRRQRVRRQDERDEMVSWRNQWRNSLDEKVLSLRKSHSLFFRNFFVEHERYVSDQQKVCPVETQPEAINDPWTKEYLAWGADGVTTFQWYRSTLGRHIAKFLWT